MKKVCEECNGSGIIWIDTTNQCTVQPWSECCGSCGYDVSCEKCNGEGELEITDIDQLEEDDTACECLDCKKTWNPIQEEEEEKPFGECPQCNSTNIKIK